MDDPQPSNSSDSSTLWFDRRISEFEAAWESGAPVVDHYMQDAPDDVRHRLLAELIRIDIRKRTEAGERIAIASYLEQFPDLLDSDETLRVPLHDVQNFIDEYGDDPVQTDETINLFKATRLVRFVVCPHCFSENQPTMENVFDTLCSNCGKTFQPRNQDADPTAKDTEGDDPPSNLKFGPYEILHVVGRGAYGSVLKAQDHDLGRTVAIKVPRAGAFPTEEEEKRFFREAQSAAGLNHPNIVQVHHVDRQGELPYIVSEFIDGSDLEYLLRRRDFSYRESAELIARVADGLDYAHRQGIIHRDIKPANIMIDVKGNPLLTDFGLARSIDAGATVTAEGHIVGTPAYMSPEQATDADNKLDARSDIYSLGVVLYELITGQRPFNGSAHNVVQQLVNDDPFRPCMIRPDIPRDLETICLKAMAREQTGRYANALAFAEDLRRFLDGLPIEAKASSHIELALKWARRRPAVAALIGVSILAPLMLLAVSLWYNVQLRSEKAKVEQARENTEQQRVLAVRARSAAEREQQLAEKRADEIRRHLYAAVLKQAKGNLSRGRPRTARQLLQTLAPGTGRDDYRDFGWHLLRKWCEKDALPDGGFRGRLFRHSMSADGSMLVTSTSRGSLSLRLPDRSVKTVQAHPTEITAVAMSPDARWLATSGSDNAVKLWRLPEFIVATILTGHHEPVSALTFSPDSAVLASGSRDHSIRLWTNENDSYTEGHVLEGHETALTCLRFNHDGTRLFSGDALVKNAGSTLRAWDTKSGKQLTTLSGHGGLITDIACNADSSLLATASTDKTVKIWKTDGNRLTAECSLQHTNPVVCVDFDNSSGVLATGSGARNHPGALALWDTESGHRLLHVPGFEDGVTMLNFIDSRLAAGDGDEAVLRFTVPQESISSGGNHHVRTLPGRPAAVLATAISPRGEKAATGDQDGGVQVWNLTRGERLHLFKEHVGAVTALAFAKSNQLLATAGADRTIHVWDLTNGSLKFVLRGHDGIVTAMNFSHDEEQLAAAGYDKDIHVWSTRTGQVLRRMPGHSAQVTSIDFNAEGLLASGSRDNTIRLWDGAESTVLTGHRRAVTTIKFSDVQTLVSLSEDKTARLWNVDTKHTEGEFTVEVEDGQIDIADGKVMLIGNRGSVQYLERGTSNPSPAAHSNQIAAASLELCAANGLAVFGHMDGKVALRDFKSGWTRTLGKHRFGVRDVAVSDDGATIVTASHQYVDSWDRVTGHRLSSFRCKSQVTALSISPDGQQIAVGCEDQTVRIWDQDAQHEWTAHPGKNGWIRSVAFSRDGNQVASASGNVVQLWRLNRRNGTLDQLAQFSGHADEVNRVLFTPDGQSLLSAGGYWQNIPSRIIVWDLEHQRIRHQMDVPQGAVQCLAAYESLIVSGQADGSVNVWGNNDQLLKSLAAHDGAVTAVQSDGNLLITSGEDGMVRQWDLATFQLRLEWRNSNVRTRSLSFSRPSRLLAAAGDDGLVRLWEAGSPNEIAALESLRTDETTSDTQGTHRNTRLNRIYRMLSDERLAAGDLMLATESARESLEARRRLQRSAFNDEDFEREARADQRRVESLTAVTRLSNRLRHAQELDSAIEQYAVFNPLESLGLVKEAEVAFSEAMKDLTRPPIREFLGAHPDCSRPFHYMELAAARNLARLGLVYEQTGKYDESIDTYRRAMSLLLPNDARRAPVYRSLMGQILIDRGFVQGSRTREFSRSNDHLRAYEIFESLTQRYPGSMFYKEQLANVSNSLSWLYSTAADDNVRNDSAALRYAERAIELVPNNLSYWNTLGLARYRNEQWQNAINSLNQSTTKVGGATGYDAVFLAMALWKSGEKKQARDWLNQALTLSAKSPDDLMLKKFVKEAQQLLTEIGTER